MPKREVIIPQGMESIYEKYHYCPGVKIGNMLYISGQVGRDENLQVAQKIEEQFIQAFENVKKVLVAAGATFDNFVEMVIYHVTGTNVGESSESQQPFTIPHLALFMKVKDCYFTQ
ncbi:Rid family hydrolase [Hydrocoleum sp. CS-953]|uniref:Rid family hydrolase n=1 Tax=Hydrocoleum sp. CS-953 TaxID=1671698 RepID=UPI001AEFE851|nr:Rid family hydrolase [Hydrocoleum sp. CS-953]